METILERRLPLPKAKLKMAKTKAHPEKRYSEVLCTLNNVGRWIKWNKDKIKNDYKDHLKEFFIPEPEREYESFTIQYRLLRDTKKTLDKDNVVFGLKWLADTMQDLGYVKDDKVVNFHSFDTEHDSSLSETMFDIRIVEGSQKWDENKINTL